MFTCFIYVNKKADAAFAGPPHTGHLAFTVQTMYVLETTKITIMKPLIKRITNTALLIMGLYAGAAKAQPTFSGSQFSQTDPDVCLGIDPAVSSNTYYILNTSGLTGLSWSVSGDLTIVSSSTTSPINIVVKSNNNGRPPEDNCNNYLDIASNAFGFGKGRIYLNYTSGGTCAQSIHFDVNKTFVQHPPIIGPTCIHIGDTVTYSICPILSVNLNAEIGQDTYYWTTYHTTAPHYDTLPNGSDYTGVPTGFTEIYRSSDGSSITYLVGATYTGGTIKCRLGACNANGTSTESSLTLGLAAVAPTVTVDGNSYTLGSTACIPTATSPITLTSSVSGNWSTDNNAWTFNSNQSTVIGATSVTLNMGQSTGKVFLTTFGNCAEPRVDTIIIGRNLGAPFSIISSTKDTCIDPSTNPTFSLTGGDLGNASVDWTISPSTGWTITGGGRGSVITTAAASNAVSTLISASLDGCSGSVSVNVNVRPVIADTIAGPKCITQGDVTTKTYSIPAVLNAVSYTWSNTATGWSGTSTTNSITYTPSGTSVGTISVVANSATDCSSAPVTVATNFIPLAPTPITIHCITVGDTGTTVISVPLDPSLTYSWTISSNTGTIIGGQGTNSITVHTLGNLGIDTVSVTASNGTCLPSPATTKYDTLRNPYSIFLFTGATPNFFLVSGASASFVTWHITTKHGAVAGSGSSGTLSLDDPAYASTVYWADIIDANGCEFWASGTSSTLGVGPEARPALGDDAILYPNPASNVVNISLPSAKGATQIAIVNGEGKPLYNNSINTTSASINTSQWANGTYTVILISEEGTKTTKKLIISK